MHRVKADCVQGGAATSRVKADCVQGRAATSCVRRKMSIAVATNGPFGKPICYLSVGLYV